MDRVKILAEFDYKEKDGVFVITAPTAISANKTVVKILENYADSKTALFLSGGSTPKKLYEEISADKELRVGAGLMIDERFGKKNHRHSNELMIRGTGLLTYFENQNIRFYPILQNDEKIENTALQYDEALRFIFEYFPNSVGILGIGEDGHTAGIPAGKFTFAKATVDKQKSKVKSQKSAEIVRRMIEDQSSLVSYYDLEGYGERITMNFQALAMLDLNIVLVLGKDKREALKLMFDPGKIEEVPARFYLKPEIAKKTILITDQII